jgi:hypothetical protein
MRRSVSNRSAMIAALSTMVLAIAAIPVAAQPATESSAQHGFGVIYDRAHEITINGSIQKVVLKSVPGAPGGLHLLVAGAQGLVDAHLGPFMTKEIQAKLQNGTEVQIVGAVEHVRGKSYLLAREVTVGGSTIIVRNERGFLLPQQNSAALALKNKGIAQTGGVQ